MTTPQLECTDPYLYTPCKDADEIVIVGLYSRWKNQERGLPEMEAS